MFKHLTDFAYKRNTKQAIGFYLTYLILIMLSSALIGGILGTIFEKWISNPFNFGLKVGNTVAILTSFGLSLIIIIQKKRLKHIGDIILAILSGILALFIGGIAGLIPTAFLSTRKSTKPPSPSNA